MGVLCSILLIAIVCAARCAETRVPGDELFSDPAIHRFKIEISAPELEKLRRDNRTYVRATVTAHKEVFKDAGVRLKGQGSFRPLDDKPSFAVKFNEYVPNQQFHGLTKLMLNNSSQDKSYLSEYLCTSLYRDGGVPAARVTFARVEFNGRELGIYVVVEAMNKPFLKQHFKNPNGTLYEGYARDINKELEHDGGPASDQSDVRALVAAAQLPVMERMDALRQVFDVDNFASFLAVGMLIAQHDSYALNRNNYRLYRDPDSGRFTMIAHGIDGSFTENAMPMFPPTNRILTKAILEPVEGQQLYRERVVNLFTNIFKLDVMTNRIHAVAARLQTAAVNEHERTNIISRAERFIDRIIERHQNVSKHIVALSYE